jgi:WD40 repeat protein
VAAIGPQSLEAATLRILSPAGDPVAGGFLISSQLALTCAHVVGNALAADQDASSPEGAVITVDLPLLARADRGGAPLTARVEKWIPEQPSGAGDVAVLRLSEQVDAAGPVRLITARTVWRHEARAFGFPDGRPDGAWHVGLLLAREKNGWVQMNQDPAAGGFPVSCGFSGSPVWDDRLGAVVGMLTAANIGDPPVSYLIPTDRLIAAWEELADLVAPPSPFRPLTAFEESENKIFYGRAAESDRVATAVAAAPSTTLVGPSGSGKSSLARAGVLPRRRAAGDIPVVIRPSQRSSPLHALAAELVPLLGPEKSGLERLEQTDRLVDRLARDGLRDVAPEVLTSQHGARLLIVIDQFEELLDLPPVHVDALAALLVDALPPAVGVLSTLRADFLEPVLAHPKLRALAGENIELLAPMTREQLEQVINQPIRDTPGVAFEANLAERILKEAGAEPGALPLLAFLLDKLWNAQSGGMLTHQAFEDLGGVHGALSAYAQGAWAHLPAREQPAARRLLSRLVQVTVGTLTATRRITPREELPEDEWRIAQRLAATGLLVLNSRLSDGGGQDSAVSVESIELAHETLITAWDVLATQITDDKDFLTWRDTLRHDVGRWAAGGHATDLLPTKTALDAAKRWLPARADELGEAEHEYLGRGRTHHRSRVRRRRGVIAAVSAMAVAAATSGAISARLNDDATRAAAIPRANNLAADAAALEPSDPGLATQLSITAYRTSPTQSAISQLYATLDTPLDSTVASTGNPIREITAQTGGPLAVAGDENGSLRIWNTAAPAAPVLQATMHTRGSAVALAPRTALMAAACPAADALCLWSLADPRRPTVISTLSGDAGASTAASVSAMAISPDGTLLAAAGADGRTFLWSIARPGQPRPIAYVPVAARSVPDGQGAVAFAPRGNLLATLEKGQIGIWNITDPSNPSRAATLASPSAAAYRTVAFSPDATMLAAAGDSAFDLWNTQDPTHPSLYDLGGVCTPEGNPLVRFSAAAFSPHGNRLTFGGADATDPKGQLCSPNLDPHTLKTGTAHVTGTPTGFDTLSMAYTADGALLTGGDDGVLRLWHWPLRQAIGAAAVSNDDWGLSPNGRLMAARLGDSGTDWPPLGIWDLAAPDGPALDASLPLHATLHYVNFLSATTLLTVTTDGATLLWDLHDPHRPGQAGTLGTASFIGGNDVIVGTGVTADASGTLVTVAGSDNLIHLWRVPDARHPVEIGSVPVPDSTADFAGTMADGRTLFMLTPAGIDWWDISDPAHPTRTGTSALHGAEHGSLITANNVLAGTSSQYTNKGDVALRVFDAARGKLQSTAALPGPVGAALGISSDGKLLAETGNAGDTITVWDTSDPQHPRTLAAVPAGRQVEFIAFDPSGKVMADWGATGSTVQVWSLADRAAPVLLLSVATPDGSDLTSAAFTPTGTMLAVSDGTDVSFFDTDPADLANRLCSYTGGTISQAQWSQFAPGIPYQNPCPLS